MKMKTFMRVFLLVTVIGCLFLQGQSEGFAQVMVKEQAVQKDKIMVKYPQFEGIENDYVQRKINMDIKVIIDKFVDTCQKDKYNREAKGDYKLHYMDAEKVSFELLTYVYSGGAHGMTQLKGYTYNLKTGQTYALTQLFDFRPTEINQKIFAHAKENDVFLFSDFKGIKIYPDNYYLNEAGKPVLLFQQYEIAPYSSGILKITMN